MQFAKTIPTQRSHPESHSGTFYILYDGEVARHANAFGSVLVMKASSVIQGQDGPSMKAFTTT